MTSHKLLELPVGDISLKIVSPEEKAFYSNSLSQFWNHVVSEDPDQTSDPLFLRTSTNYRDEGPLNRTGPNKITISTYQSIFIPVCVSNADEKHDPGTTLIDVIKKGFKDSPPVELTLTLDNHKIVEDFKKFYFESTNFDLEIAKNAKLKHTPLYLIYPGKWKSAAAGYCLIMESLPERKIPYWFYIKSKLKDGYTTAAYYEINVVAKCTI